VLEWPPYSPDWNPIIVEFVMGKWCLSTRGENRVHL
jgi:hypothetical protein